MVCSAVPVRPQGTAVIGLRALAACKQGPPRQLQGAQHIAHRLPREVCYTRHLSSAFFACPFPQTMTLPSLEQVVTSINQVQSTIEVVSSSDSHAKVNANRLPRHFPQISASHKQSQESWTTTQDALSSLMALVQRCNARDFEAGSELQQPLSDLQRCLC